MSPEMQKRYLESLTWYLLQARIQRHELHKYQTEHPGDRGHGDPSDREHFARVAIWYTALAVVIEGWKLLGIDDPNISKLNADQPEMIEKLGRFRNKTVHPQPDYPAKHHLELISDPKSVMFAYALNDALEWAIARERKR